MSEHKRSYYIVNGITIYRIMAAPVLLVLVLNEQYNIFRWLLALSFFTDAVDGYLARKYHAVSILGARLDSIADDLTVTMAIAGIMKLNARFLFGEMAWISVVLILFILQLSMALIRYGKMTAFHTYLAKVAAVTQAAFLISFFFITKFLYLLFYTCVILTGLDLVEEILLILVLPLYTLNVKGLYWVLKEKAVNAHDVV